MVANADDWAWAPSASINTIEGKPRALHKKVYRVCNALVEINPPTTKRLVSWISGKNDDRTYPNDCLKYEKGEEPEDCDKRTDDHKEGCDEVPAKRPAIKGSRARCIHKGKARFV